ncbi:hypothetical protein ACIBI4_21935 [Streptomyces sp. NPDC050418]|uniref:hypothetical protein n=1 Tax=Streptomyces sp. NPDC050418 TaxID=3365612 RepID=UPI0037BA4B8E
MSNRLPVENGGQHLTSLFVEPYGEDFWMSPGEVFTVIPSVDADVEIEFSVIVKPDHVTVWMFHDGDPYNAVLDFKVVGQDGVTLECGHQRPLDSPEASPRTGT